MSPAARLVQFLMALGVFLALVIAWREGGTGPALAAGLVLLAVLAALAP